MPREELLTTGTLGPAGAQLLYTTVRLVAVGHRFPKPEGSQSWDETAVTETAHDFLKDDRGRKRLTDITIRSVDDRSFERLLEAAVLNFLRDVARRTDFGKLVVRVKDVLRSSDEFQTVAGAPDRWALAGGPTEPSGANPALLESATACVEVVVPRWTSDRRDPPLADRCSFIRLMTSVLTAAAGSLTAVDIAHALAARLDHRRSPLTMDLDILEGISEPAQLSENPADQTAARLHAADIFNSLSDRERIIITTLETTVRDLAALIGTGKTQAAIIRQRLFDKLAAELDDPDSADDTVAALMELCTDWRDRRTTAADATSLV
jgi:hypothetical protein